LGTYIGYEFNGVISDIPNLNPDWPELNLSSYLI
jgi:hypothetical protein